MLTRNDETIADARAVYGAVADLGIRHVGCKDVGVPREELDRLLADIRANGHTSYLEVVSDTKDATLRSARVAADIGPDYLIGGTFIQPIQEVLQGTGIKFFPYVGKIEGHPCVLRGSIDEIREHARRAETAGVDGINLLAYRYDGDVPRLVEGVASSVEIPLICAGSIDSVARIRKLADLGVWAFTIGTAVLDGRIAPGGTLEEQIWTTLDAAEAPSMS